MMHKVLWIDDELNQGSFIRQATKYDLEIEQVECYFDGINKLKGGKTAYSAVILDVNCKYKSDEEVTSVEAIREHLHEITGYCESKDERLVPWFVYTADTGDAEGYVNSLRKNKPWDDVAYYNKGDDYKLLFEHIQNAIEKVPLNMIHKKYEVVFSVCPDKKDELERVMLAVENNDFKDASTFNDMRKVLEWVKKRSGILGFLREDVKTLRDVSYFMRQISKKDAQFVPEYISGSFYYVEGASQNGSHGEDDKEPGAENNLVVDRDVKTGRAPYLLNGVFYSLLTLINWLGSLSDEAGDVEERRNKVLAMNIPFDKKDGKKQDDTDREESASKAIEFPEYEGKEFVLEQEDGILHCGYCCVHEAHVGKVGKAVRLENVVPNTWKNKYEKYKCFAKKVTVVGE